MDFLESKQIREGMVRPKQVMSPTERGGDTEGDLEAANSFLFPAENTM